VNGLLRKITAGAGRRILRKAAANGWVQERAWELITARTPLPHGADADFLSFCASRSRCSNAQLCQDLWVLWETGGKRDGYFVEFGATDGVSLSNTCLLERSYGWQGILAEPFTVWHAQLARNRTAHIDHRCVWKQSGEQLDFTATPQLPEYAGVSARAFDDLHATRRARGAQRTCVPSVSLQDLLREHAAPAHIDYLSIDTEGSELDILEAFDFGAWRVDLLSVEHAFNAGKRAALQRLLERHGFRRRFQRFSLWDDWYVNRALLAERGALN
jgi:FkbM family methyltransferase